MIITRTSYFHGVYSGNGVIQVQLEILERPSVQLKIDAVTRNVEELLAESVKWLTGGIEEVATKESLAFVNLVAGNIEEGMRYGTNSILSRCPTVQAQSFAEHGFWKDVRTLFSNQAHAGKTLFLYGRVSEEYLLHPNYPPLKK
jgi:hypothetical protein